MAPKTMTSRSYLWGRVLLSTLASEDTQLALRKIPNRYSEGRVHVASI